MSKNILVFLKSPRLGRVKTRLAKDVGVEQALHVYEWLTDYTLKQIKNVVADVHLYYNEEPEHKSNLDQQTIHIQVGNDLGEMMMNAMQDFQKRGPAVLIGSDCPEITPNIIEEAFKALNKYDAVLGPALDGGFYLIAVNRFPDNMFKGIEWGGTDVLIDVLKNLENKTVYQLPVLSDIDNVEDFKKFETEHKEYLRTKSIFVETEN